MGDKKDSVVDKRKDGGMTKKQLKLIQCEYYAKGVFKGRDNLYRHLRNVDNADPLTRKQVWTWLQKQELWQTTQRQRREKNFRPFVPTGPRSVLQIDLIGPLKGCAEQGDKHAVILVDLFTRKMWSRSIKNPKAITTWNALQHMLDREVFEDHKMKNKWTLSSDNGSEFIAEFSVGLQKYSNGVTQVFGVSGKSTNQAYVERANQSVKSLMYKLMKTNDNFCFTSFLPVATTNYNESHHRTIGMSPNDADKADQRKQADIRKKLMAPFQTLSVQEGGARLRLGDFVRIRKDKTGLSHQYLDNYSDKVYTVHKIIFPHKQNVLLKYVLAEHPKIRKNDIDVVVVQKNRLGTKTMNYTRGLLLKMIDGSPEKAPEKMNTFKKFCVSCNKAADTCLDYNEYLKNAEIDKGENNKQKGPVDTSVADAMKVIRGVKDSLKGTMTDEDRNRYCNTLYRALATINSYLKPRGSRGNSTVVVNERKKVVGKLTLPEINVIKDNIKNTEACRDGTRVQQKLAAIVAILG